MAHFVRTLGGDGFLNLDRLDGIVILGPSSPNGAFLVVGERHGSANTILSRQASAEDALAYAERLLGDAIHDG